MMTEPVPDEAGALAAFLDAQHVMSVATGGADGSACAAVFYAVDDDGALVFVSDAASRHARHLAANPACAVTINGNARDWRAICGAQMRGAAGPVDGPARAAARERYLERFPELRAQLAEPANAKLADRLAAATIFRFVPDWARLIDNSRGFAARDEFVRDGSRWQRVATRAARCPRGANEDTPGEPA